MLFCNFPFPLTMYPGHVSWPVPTCRAVSLFLLATWYLHWKISLQCVNSLGQWYSSYLKFIVCIFNGSFLRRLQSSRICLIQMWNLLRPPAHLDTSIGVRGHDMNGAPPWSHQGLLVKWGSFQAFRKVGFPELASAYTEKQSVWLDRGGAGVSWGPL